MARPSSPRLLVLHVLRLKGFAGTDVVAEALAGPGAGMAEPDVVATLTDLAGSELVQRRDGKVSGWSLTKPGRAAHVELLHAELDSSGGEEAGERATVEEAYREFLGVNGDMLATCTDWQLRSSDGGQVVNDHTDQAWDAAVLDRLADIDARIRPTLERLGAALDRYRRYPPRLAAALARVQAGEREWFTRPVIDSYHTVWFELHEDLLCTLGIERASESQTGA